MSSSPDEPVLLLHWEETVGILLDKTARFPKSARFSFAGRIDGLALDVLEALVRARWAPRESKARWLADADLHLAVLRTMLRLAHERHHLPLAGFEHLVRRVDEAGRMLGGWRKQVGA